MSSQAVSNAHQQERSPFVGLSFEVKAGAAVVRLPVDHNTAAETMLGDLVAALREERKSSSTPIKLFVDMSGAKGLSDETLASLLAATQKKKREETALSVIIFGLNDSVREKLHRTKCSDLFTIVDKDRGAELVRALPDAPTFATKIQGIVREVQARRASELSQLRARSYIEPEPEGPVFDRGILGDSLVIKLLCPAREGTDAASKFAKEIVEATSAAISKNLKGLVVDLQHSHIGPEVLGALLSAYSELKGRLFVDNVGPEVLEKMRQAHVDRLLLRTAA